MSNNDVADIQAILKDIGVTATPEQITARLSALEQFKVTGSQSPLSESRGMFREEQG